MKVALSDKPERQENRPPNIVEVKIDASSGLLGDSLTEFFIKGTEPTKRYIIERGYYVPPEIRQAFPSNQQSGELF